MFKPKLKKATQKQIEKDSQNIERYITNLKKGKGAFQWAKELAVADGSWMERVEARDRKWRRREDTFEGLDNMVSQVLTEYHAIKSNLKFVCRFGKSRYKKNCYTTAIDKIKMYWRSLYNDDNEIPKILHKGHYCHRFNVLLPNSEEFPIGGRVSRYGNPPKFEVHELKIGYGWLIMAEKKLHYLGKILFANEDKASLGFGLKSMLLEKDLKGELYAIKGVFITPRFDRDHGQWYGNCAERACFGYRQEDPDGISDKVYVGFAETPAKAKTLCLRRSKAAVMKAIQNY